MTPAKANPPPAPAPALRADEAILRLVIDQIPAILWTTDEELVITSSTGAGLVALGQTPGQTVGRRLEDVLGTGEDVRLPLDAHRKALQGESQTYEILWGKRNYRTRIEPLRDAAGTIRGTVGLAFDITDFRRAELELRQNERRFWDGFDHSPIGMTITGLDGRFLRVNPAFARMLGYDPADLLRRSFDSVTHPEDRADGIRAVRRLIAGEIDTYEVEKRYQHADGRTIHIQLSAVPVRDADGRIVCFFAQMQDITDRWSRDQELCLVESLSGDVIGADDFNAALATALRKVCEHTGWVIGQSWIPGADRRSMECSPAWFTSAEGLARFRAVSEAMRIPPGVGLPGRVWQSGRPAWVRDLTQDADSPRATAAAESGLKAGLAFPVKADGETVAVLEFFVRERREEDEAMARLVAAVADRLGFVFRRKKIETALQESEEKYRSLFEGSNDAILVADVPRGRWVDANDRAERLTGYTRGELRGLTIEDLAPPERGEEVRESFRGLLRDKSLRTETEIRTRSGTDVAVEVSARLVPIGGRTYAQLVYRDVADRKRSAAALESSLSLLRATIESTTDGILVVDAEEKIVLHNRKFADMWRIPTEVLESGRDDRAIASVLGQLTDPDAFLAKVRMLYDNPEAESYDVLTFKDGRIFERYSQPRRIGPAAAGRVWSFRDVTERRRTLNALLESETRFRLVAQATNDVIRDWDLLSNRVVWSDNVRNLLGSSPDPSVSDANWWHGRIHTDDRDRVVASVHSVIRNGGRHWTEEYRMTGRDGAVVSVIDRGYVVHNERGIPLRMIGCMTDVTERRRAAEEERARVAEVIRHQQALLDLSRLEETDLTEVFRRVTETGGAVLDVARTSLWLFSPDRSEFHCEDLHLLGARTHEQGLRLLARDYPAYFRAVEESSLVAADDARNDPRTREFRDGYLVPLGITSMMDVAVRRHGKTAGVLCHEHVGPVRAWTPEEQRFAASLADRVSLAMEAADRRRLEQGILAISGREQQRIGQDLHDGLGQQLAGIAFLSRVLVQKLGQTGRPEAEDAGQIERLVQESIAQTRNLARMLVPVALEENGLRVALQELADQTRRAAGLECRFEGPADAVFEDRTASAHLYRIAQEAVANAVKHSGARRILISLATTGGGMTLTVEDDGRGFDPAGERSGIGLDLMRYRARLIGTGLDVGPRSGGGTRVAVALKAPAAVRSKRRGRRA